MHFKTSRDPLPVIARALNVDYVVEGSVVRQNNRVRVTVQLIDARSDDHLWAETFDRRRATRADRDWPNLAIGGRFSDGRAETTPSRASTQPSFIRRK